MIVALVLFGAATLAPPDAPTGLTAHPENNGISTQWLANSGSEIADYRLSRRRDGDDIGFFVATIVHPATTFLDTTAIGGVFYTYKVQARDIFASISAFSDSVTARFLDDIPPSPPDSVLVTESDEGLFLSWARNPENDVDRYRVERSDTGGPFLRVGESEHTGLLDTTSVIGQPYRYRVLAIDFSGNEGDASEPIPGLLHDRIAPGRVSDVEATGIAEGIFLSWQAAPESDVAGYQLRRGIRTDESFPLVDLPLGQLSFLDTTAVERVFYIYRIAAVDQSGNVGEPEFAQALRPDLRAPSTPLRLSASWSEVALALDWAPNLESDLAVYRVRAVSLTDASETVIEVPPHRSGLVITPFGSGLPTRFQVTAVDSSGNESLPTPFIETALVPSQIRIETIPRRLGTAGDNALDFRLISVPGDFGVDFAATFAGVRGLDWQLLRSDATETTGSVILNPGQAVWAYSAYAWSIPRQTVGQVIPSGLGYTFAIALTPGWNVIANPFALELDWPMVMDWNSTNGALFAYAGRFEPTRRFRPYTGYLFYNRDNLDELTLPFARARLSGAGWSPADRLTVQAEAGWLRSVELAADSSASQGLDSLDRFLPPRFFGGAQLAVRDKSGEAMRSLSVQPSEESREYDIRLTEAQGVVRFSVHGSLPGMNATLIDEVGIYHPLGDSPVPVVIRSSDAALSLLVSPVGAPPIQAVPQSEGIDAVFPNPSRSWVAVDYTVDIAGEVQLEVFDLLGRRVATLSSDKATVGRHQIVWSPRDSVTAGAYVVRLNTPSGPSSRLIWLVR